MWAALAVEQGDVAHHAPEPFYATAEFWVAVGFIILLGLIGKRAYRLVIVSLDERAERIRGRIDETARLAEEAQALLATYERKQRDAAGEAEQILADARREVDRLTEHAAAELERSLRRREEMAIERISQAEAAAVAEVRASAVDVAVEATQRLIAAKMTAKQSDALIDAAIAELPGKLH
jgi:F-type H+-transporting ATPase subunit b